MTNKEKYANKIIEIAVRSKLALKDGKPVPCADVRCKDCDFVDQVVCKSKLYEWLDSEYVEPPVDWSKVAVDTPILVKNYRAEIWKRRYFAKYENGTIYAWLEGTTSWSASGTDDDYMADWKMAKLAESEE